jgi:hypothetical protein
MGLGSDLCDFCRDCTETTIHVLRDCKLVRNLWISLVDVSLRYQIFTCDQCFKNRTGRSNRFNREPESYRDGLNIGPRMLLNWLKPEEPLKTGEPTVLENRRFECFFFLFFSKLENDTVLFFFKQKRKRKIEKEERNRAEAWLWIVEKIVDS